MPLRRLPLLLLALSLPVTTSYGRVYSLSPHLGDVGGGMRVNLTGRDFVDYGDVRCRFGTNAWTRAVPRPSAARGSSRVPRGVHHASAVPARRVGYDPSGHPNRDEPVRVCVEVTTNNDPDQATDDCQLFTYFDD